MTRRCDQKWTTPIGARSLCAERRVHELVRADSVLAALGLAQGCVVDPACGSIDEVPLQDGAPDCRNIGMTLHVIHTLRAQGIRNVQVNMDWQHLIMNGENLGEYAAMLAAEGLLGHQHANSGWGTFDDDNMVGATAFMETLELAVELRRAGYGANGERLGFDLYPYTEDAVAAVKRSVLQWNFIDAAAERIDDAALREAQSRKDAVRAYELVYAALGA